MIEKDKKQFVLLPYAEFAAIQRAPADAEDLVELRAAKKEEADAPGIPLDQAIEELGLSR